MVDKNKSHSDVKKLLYRLKQPSFEVFVSQTVLGEVVAKILQKHTHENRNALSELPQILQDHNIDPAASLTPPLGTALEIMRHLHRADQYLDTTDIMIVSHVLADPKSKFFFTNDSKLIGNLAICEHEADLRNRKRREAKLEIKDGF